MHTEKALRHKDGSVLLSVADDRICKLNGVGALTWMVLEGNPAGLSVEDVVRELSGQFEAINAEGRLRYDVSLERLRSDTARFLEKLTEMNLLRREVDPPSQEHYRINDGVSGTTAGTATATATAKRAEIDSSATPAKDSSSKSVSAQSEFTSSARERHIRPLKRETLTAFIALLAFDLLLKVRGFESLIKKVERWPTAEPRTTDIQICRRVRAMVDRAQMYYPKKAMCLQHSAVVTCLLRRRGVPAEMVLAAQHLPAKAHAWVEVAGTVVNENQSVRTKYLRLRQV